MIEADVKLVISFDPFESRQTGGKNSFEGTKNMVQTVDRIRDF